MTGWTTRRAGSVALGTVLVLGCAGVSACGGDDEPESSARKQPSATAGSTTSAASGGASRSAQPSQSVSPSRAPDPLASATPEPVIRDGRVPKPSLSAAPAPIRGTVGYRDGVKLRITGVSQGQVSAEGPGEVQGPTTTFAVQLRNGGSRSLSLNAVVVTLAYGKPARVASPYYGAKNQDFSGTVRPGRSARAVYTFMVPVSQRSRVSVRVDFDSVHAAATFTGSSLG